MAATGKWWQLVVTGGNWWHVECVDDPRIAAARRKVYIAACPAMQLGEPTGWELLSRAFQEGGPAVPRALEDFHWDFCDLDI